MTITATWASKNTRRIKASVKTWPRESSASQSFTPSKHRMKINKCCVSIHGLTLISVADKDQILSDILRQRTRDVEVKKYCVSLLEKLGSFKYTRETLDALDKEARNEVELLGPNPIMNTLLDELLSWKQSTDWGWLEHFPIKKPRLIWYVSQLRAN